MEAKILLCSVVICAAMTSCLGAIVKPITMNKLHFVGELIVGNNAPPSNDVSSCWVSTPPSTITPKTCPVGATECLSVTFIAHPSGEKEQGYGYGCANEVSCSSAGKQMLCKEIEGEYPFPITDCKVTCCSTNNCNIPQESKVVPKVIGIERFNLLPAKLPSNDVDSCYTSIPPSTIVPKSCPAGATECLSVTFEVNPPGEPAESGYGYGCANDLACSAEGKKEVCNEAAQSFPYPVTDCKVTCCATNNCNSPKAVAIAPKIFKIDHFALSSSLPSNDVSSCYISTSTSINPGSCPAGATECLSVTFTAHTPGGNVPGYGYGCANDATCSPAGMEEVCKDAAQSFPFPITDCQVTCCSTDNCNVPQRQKNEKGIFLKF